MFKQFLIIIGQCGENIVYGNEKGHGILGILEEHGEILERQEKILEKPRKVLGRA